MDRDAQIQRYKERIRRYENEQQLYKDMICTWKAEAQKWKLYHSRMEEALTMRGQAIHAVQSQMFVKALQPEETLQR